MTKDNFNILLKKANFSKTNFAKQFNLTVGTVNNWGSSKDIPYWVESWLQNYIKAKDLDNIVDTVKPYIKP
jgi:DNA-binding transcriptional regulator YiaG